MTTIAITHANLVLRDEVLEDGAVLMEGGRIVEVGPCTSVGWRSADQIVDGEHRLFVVPGIVDTHCDGLETEVNPRPRVNFDGPFAIRNYERRALAAGVTTSFHAVTFANMARVERSISDASDRTDLVRAARASAGMDHQILHRCDVWTPDGLPALLESMRAMPVQAVSLNDHTPGQGQYRDLDTFKKTMMAMRAADPNYDAEADIAARIASRANDTTTVASVLGRLRKEFEEQPFIMAAHDDDSREKTEAMHALGCTIAEFPVVMESAQRARELGMWITVGAPNIVRGGSTSGNQDATELVREGLADIICADYHLPSMIMSAWHLAKIGVCSLPDAVAMLTDKPARAFGLTDRGRIEVGMAADLLCAEIVDGRPVVISTWYRGRAVFGSEVARPALASAQA